ncbi:MAG: SAM-dependent methyltransferase [Legionellaceae bacterium]|nr:SAM-dependent methyltransferase [Legionellaceae bacterium]
MTLINSIQNTIKKNGAIPFVDFMQMALYSPQWGYYNTTLQPFGPTGDFTTAPELTPLFGYAIANQCEEILNELNNPILFEFGAGSGRLCVDVLTHLERLDALPEEYHILDVSGHLQARQQELIQQTIPHLATRVRWLHQWPNTPFNGVVIANEVLDAMPVHRFLKTEHELFELYVDLNQQGNLIETVKPCSNTQLIKHIQTVFPETIYPYQSEINLFVDDWILQCHDMLEQGVMLILDYGFPRQEFYHPDRNQGTLMCHYQHQTHTNPLVNVGQQDITAHVDFTHVAEAAFNAGFKISGYTNQASFLLGNGILDLLEKVAENKRVNAQQATKMLLQPNEMGELFKVIALSKQMELRLKGFQFHDKRVSL